MDNTFRKAKFIGLIVISLGFTAGGVLLIEKTGWFPASFFGICSVIFIYMYFNPQKETIPYDKMFLSETDRDKLQYNDKGFSDPDNGYIFYWDKIHLITACKRDLLTYDDICLCIEHEFDFLTVSESFPGWEKFKEEIENRFDVTESKWFEQMANHAFGNDEIILYKKQMAK